MCMNIYIIFYNVYRKKIVFQPPIKYKTRNTRGKLKRYMYVHVLSFLPVYYVKHYSFYIFAQMSVLCQIILFHVYLLVFFFFFFAKNYIPITFYCIMYNVLYIGTECLESLKSLYLKTVINVL